MYLPIHQAMVIDRRSRVPIVTQVLTYLHYLIAIRALRPGDNLPSVRAFAAELRVNEDTVKQAYQELRKAGGLRTGRGSRPPVISARARDLPVPAHLASVVLSPALAVSRALGCDRGAVMGVVEQLVSEMYCSTKNV